MADGSVTIEVSLSKEQLKKALQQLESDFNQLENKTNKISEKVAKGFDSIGNAATKAGKSLTLGLTTPLAALATAGVKYNVQLEKYNSALTTLTGSAEEAARIMEQIEQDAAKTPFDVSGLTQANQLLISTGLSADESRETILALGDAVSATGGGNDELSRMAVNLQQIKNTGKATALDIKQFAYAGIDIYGLLADYTGKTKEEVADMEISWDNLNGALIKASKQGGKYFKAMEKQSETTGGAVSNFQDSFNRFASSLTRSFMPTVKKVINKVTDWLEKFENLDDSTKNNIIRIGLFVAAIGPVLTIFGKLSTTISGGIKTVNLIIDAFKVANGTLTTTSTAVKNLANMFTFMTNPVTLACTAIVAVIGTVAVAVANSEKQVTEKFESMADGANSFNEGIKNAEGYLSSFNSTLFASTEEQQELQQQMDEIQEGITSICKKASDERRGYTEKEITQLDEYFKKLRELKDREIQIQNEIAKAISQQAITNAEAFSGSLEEYQIQSQEWIKTAQEQANATKAIIEQNTIEEIALLNTKYGEAANMQNAAYAEEYNKILEQKQAKIDAANEEVAKVCEAYANGYIERETSQNGFAKKIEEANKKAEQEEQRHNDSMLSMKNSFWGKHYDISSAIQQENENYRINTKRIWEDMYKNMSDSEAEQLGVWLAMQADTELWGGEISEENQDMVDTILDSYEKMPKKTKEAMKNAMSPMLTEMQNKEPSLFAKASGIANGILSRLKKAFDIHSPSKKTKAIFKNVMLGAEKGLENEEKSIYKQVDNISKMILKGFDISSLYSKMQNRVNLETQKLSASLTTGNIINIDRSSDVQATLNSIDNNREINVNSTIELDGKVVANTVNKVNAKQRLQYGLA